VAAAAIEGMDAVQLLTGQRPVWPVSGKVTLWRGRGGMGFRRALPRKPRGGFTE
jgi:hypothetical protein